MSNSEFPLMVSQQGQQQAASNLQFIDPSNCAGGNRNFNGPGPSYYQPPKVLWWWCVCVCVSVSVCVCV